MDAAFGGGCICPDELVSTSKFFRTAIAVWRHRRASFRPVTAQSGSRSLFETRLTAKPRCTQTGLISTGMLKNACQGRPGYCGRLAEFLKLPPTAGITVHQAESGSDPLITVRATQTACQGPDVSRCARKISTNMSWRAVDAGLALGVPPPALRCAGKEAVRARTAKRALQANDI
jgi:hypothetical protein